VLGFCLKRRCRSRHTSFVVRMSRRESRPATTERGPQPMRVMVIVKATKESEAEINPGDEKLLKEMGA